MYHSQVLGKSHKSNDSNGIFKTILHNCQYSVLDAYTDDQRHFVEMILTLT